MLESFKGATTTLGSATSRFFSHAIDFIVKLLMPLTIVALMMGVARVFLGLWSVWKAPSIADGFDLLVTDILSTFVVIELLKSIVEYFDTHRLKLTFILDAAVVFVLRELMISLYKHQAEPNQVAAIALLLLVMGAFRIATTRFSPERRPVDAP